VTPTKLRVLLVEDSPDDAELVRIQLRRAGFDTIVERVETADEFSAAIEAQSWDVILADHALPTFDAAQALALLAGKQVDLPFIVMSGMITQEVAIELMRSGAHDFVAKSNPARLEPVIRRELREAENRRARRRAEAEREALVVKLEAANRAKDEFLAMLGHELRNPLAPIVTALQLMKLRGDGRPSREFDIIERQVNHLVRLVDDLLDVAKITKGKVDLKRRVVELSELVARGVEIASPLIEQRMHHFQIDVPRRGLRVAADEARLAQVISNLLTNAARYTGQGGEIALTAVRDGADAVLCVKDNGIGIGPEMLPKIFDLFVQGPRPIDRTEGGLGLGLALVRNLVSMHGGSVAAHSEGPDRGSEFVVRLPLASPDEDEAAPLDPAPHAAVGQRHAGQRVLLVDDNRDALEVMAEAVRLEGYEVEIAYDGPTALVALDQFAPTVIVLDIGLPVMDGYEVARQIRARPAHAATRLIALTGYGQASDRARAEAAGFDVHLVKPVSISTLLAEVQALPAAGSDQHA
jgi:signal transduction histidine kinase